MKNSSRKNSNPIQLLCHNPSSQKLVRKICLLLESRNFLASFELASTSLVTFTISPAKSYTFVTAILSLVALSPESFSLDLLSDLEVLSTSKREPNRDFGFVTDVDVSVVADVELFSSEGKGVGSNNELNL